MSTPTLLSWISLRNHRHPHLFLLLSHYSLLLFPRQPSSKHQSEHLRYTQTTNQYICIMLNIKQTAYFLIIFISLMCNYEYARSSFALNAAFIMNFLLLTVPKIPIIRLKNAKKGPSHPIAVLIVSGLLVEFDVARTRSKLTNSEMHIAATLRSTTSA